MSEILHFKSGEVSLQSVEALMNALAELRELRSTRDALQAENTRLVNENRRLKTGDIGEAYNAGEEKVTGLLGAANKRVKACGANLFQAEARLRQWDELRSWFMDYPASIEDEELNKRVADAEPREVVQAIKEGNAKLRQEFQEARAELAEYRHNAGVEASE